jgi:alanyl-tRNA synthetase
MRLCAPRNSNSITLNTMNVSEIRRQFIDYFVANGHTTVASLPLVPPNDPTLLFTNAGMVQFKDVFLGVEQRPYKRAVSSQRCVRAGGKHNDLENVGYTARHHTFFEMLGNFSFGDYFKRDAIFFAWELLTKVYKLPQERLWATVYIDDDEAYDIWANEIKIPKERLVRIGDNKGAKYASDNFWQMADVGPCGPCSEIFYDHGPGIAGGPPGSPDAEADRYIEIWNLVFMQYNRDAQGTLTPLPAPCVDTGMGLERLAAVLQNVHSNYDIDLFQSLIAAAAKATGCKDKDSPSLRVIADHIRACAFLIVDGVIPGSEGRGYVLRRIIRRAIRHGYKLGQKKPFFYTLVETLAKTMGDAYPELMREQARVAQVLQMEEQRFGETIDNGMKLLDDALKQMQGSGTATLSGETAFTLYDTFGFPLDLTSDVCRERGVTVDEAGFDKAMQAQRERARMASQFKVGESLVYQGPKTTFEGYERLEDAAKIVALYNDGVSVTSLKEGECGVVVLDRTPFYAESGGQVGDVGLLHSNEVSFSVQDTQKIQPDVFGHIGEVTKGVLNVGDTVQTAVDRVARTRTVRNHSATHLMHKALREVLGSHVQQKGSLVNGERTRFDFSHFAPVTAEEMARVETKVNEEILMNDATQARLMSFDDALKSGAMALFGEKYGDTVRVLNIGSSCELCGGTHVNRTGDIGLFKIVAEGGIAAGIRRIEAVAGEGVIEYLNDREQILQRAAGELKVSPGELDVRVAHLTEQMKLLEKEVARLKSKLAGSQIDGLMDQAVEIGGGAKLLAATLEGIDPATLRETLDKLKDKLKSAVIVLATVRDEKVSLIAGVTADLTGKVKAGELVNFAAQQVGGKGGGRPDMAQAGGTQPEGLAAALQSVRGWVEERMA